MEVTRQRHPQVQRGRGFTLLELMVVIAIVMLALGFLVPALSPSTGRSLEGAARQFTTDLENARQIAIAERIKTRVLIPDKNDANFGADLGLRAYNVVSFNRTANTWRQRGRWVRLPQAAAFDQNPQPLATDEMAVIPARKTKTTPVDNSSSGTGGTKTFTGAYVEFRPNGSTDLDPASPLQIVVIADGISDGKGTMTAKNTQLRYRVTIEPLTGSVRLK